MIASTSLERQAAEQAVTILTAFSLSTEGEEIDETTGETLCSLVDGLIKSETCVKTLYAIASITDGLLERCAEQMEIDKYALLSGIAQSLYGSIA